MNPPPLFSVIIPTYNRTAKLVRAVESVLQQTCQDFDLWVIDDGSTDATQEALEPFAGRLNYCYQANQGTCVARNTGIQNSNGRYIAFLDSDDHWLPDKLAVIEEAIQAHPEVGVFYSSVTNVDEDGRILWEVHAREVHGSAYIEMLKADFMVLSSVVVKRECLKETGLFDAALKMSEDWDLLIRLARQYPILAVPETLVIFEYGSPGMMPFWRKPSRLIPRSPQTRSAKSCLRSPTSRAAFALKPAPMPTPGPGSENR